MTPQATIFDFATPATVDSGDTDAVELGVKFQTDFAGAVTGIRFYKAAPTPARTSAACGPPTGTRLAPGDVHQRDRVRLAGR